MPSFASVLHQHKLLLATQKFERDSLEAEFKACFAHAFRSKYPKSKAQYFKAMSKKDTALNLEVLACFEKLAEMVSARQKDERDASEKNLIEAADVFAPLPSNETIWTLFRTTYSATYSSQTASVAYAKAAAQNIVDHVQSCGIDAHVVRVNHPRTRGAYNSYSYDGADFQVWVATDRLGAEALKHKPPQESLRQWLKRCWSRGANPRVFNPYLPHGLEEKLGLNYFGQDTGNSKYCTALVAITLP